MLRTVAKYRRLTAEQQNVQTHGNLKILFKNVIKTINLFEIIENCCKTQPTIQK